MHQSQIRTLCQLEYCQEMRHKEGWEEWVPIELSRNLTTKSANVSFNCTTGPAGSVFVVFAAKYVWIFCQMSCRRICLTKDYLLDPSKIRAPMYWENWSIRRKVAFSWRSWMRLMSGVEGFLEQSCMASSAIKESRDVGVHKEGLLV